MIKSKYFNDAPILEPKDDQFGIDQFAEAISKSYKRIETPVGATIAVNGPWGSGKSSAVNLIRYHLKSEVELGNLDIIDFKCWWFRGEEALTLAFLQELNASLQKNLGEKAKELIPRLGKILLQAGPVVGPAINLAGGGVWGKLASGSMNYVKRFFPEGESVEKIFESLYNALEEKNKRFLVIIDDIDRLSPNEALLIFRLVKSVGRLPNVMYLLVFDRELAEKAVTEIYPSEGPHFLEKIIQASFELPLPARDDLNMAVLSQIEAICGLSIESHGLREFMNLFYDAVSPYINTPRDLTRLSNSMAVSWPAIDGDVDIGEYVALETMKLFEPQLYNAVRTNKDLLCGIETETMHEMHRDPQQELESFLKVVPEGRRDNGRLSLLRLFPRFEKVTYSPGFIEEWESKRRLCTRKHFDTYFRMGIGDETLSMVEVDKIINNASDKEYIKRSFFNALHSIRKNGKSKVPLLFDELNAHAGKIEKEDLIPLISAIFEIADDIYRGDDNERGGFTDNHLRIHWLIRKLTFDKCDLSERSFIFLSACQNAQVGWLVDFTSSAILDYFPGEGKTPEPAEKCLMDEEHLQELKHLSIEAVRTSAKKGKLIHHPLLPSILYRWREFAKDDGAEVKIWTDNQLENNESVSLLAQAFTGERWTQGIGFDGLGDRVALRDFRASINGLEHIMNVEKFRRRLEEMEDNEKLDVELKKSVLVFLDSWRKQENGEYRYG